MKPVIKRLIQITTISAAIVAICFIIFYNNENVQLSIIERQAQESILFTKNVRNQLKVQEDVYPCIHDKIIAEEAKLGQPEQYIDDEVFQQTAQWDETQKLSELQSMKPIRIHFDYSNLADTDEDIRNFIQHDLIPAAGQFFQEFLKVKPVDGRIKLDPYYRSHKCGAAKIVIPKDHIDNGVDADIIFYISAQNEAKERFLAYASTCPQSRSYGLKSGRPTVGYFNMNLFYLAKHVRETDPMRKSQWIWTTIHEMTHSLAFSPNHFRHFLKDRNPITYDDNFTYINAPSLIKLVKDHFDCDSAIGAPLEDEGGMGTAGAHWERKIFGNELMTGSAMYDSVISEFTAQVFQISGWYEVNFEKAGRLSWGKGKGCQFLNGQKCDYDSSQFCRGGSEVSCSYDYSGLAGCQNDPLSDKCNYYMAYANTHCNYPPPQIASVFKKFGGAYGSSSRCWKTDLVRKIAKKSLNSLCFESKCNYDDPDNPIASFKYNSNWYSCKMNTKSVTTNEDYEFTCPDVYAFCHSLSACPDSCSARGNCNNGVCSCTNGFTGANCADSHN